MASARIPDVNMKNTERFSDLQEEFLPAATTDQLRQAVYKASVWIENATYEGRASGSTGADQVNNCTALIGGVTGELIRRLEDERAKRPVSA